MPIYPAMIPTRAVAVSLNAWATTRVVHVPATANDLAAESSHRGAQFLPARPGERDPLPSLTWARSSGAAARRRVRRSPRRALPWAPPGATAPSSARLAPADLAAAFVVAFAGSRRASCRCRLSINFRLAMSVQPGGGRCAIGCVEHGPRDELIRSPRLREGWTSATC
jgi:hypothetical protein